MKKRFKISERTFDIFALLFALILSTLLCAYACSLQKEPPKQEINYNNFADRSRAHL